VGGFSNFAKVTTQQAADVINAIKNRTFPVDFIPTSLLKELEHHFAPSIALLANLSFSQGVFPDGLKTGKISPILKKKGLDINIAANYRPITSLGTLSKILERLALLQLRPVITGSAGFFGGQSAYRAAHSTETALLKVTADVRVNMEGSSTTCLLSLDISAAFDVLDHATLVKRARDTFGISGIAQSWLASYLACRRSYVSIGGGSHPDSGLFSCPRGVPQGSTLGPVLFALYVSPVGFLAEGMGVSCHQYADDTQLYLRLSAGVDNIAALN
jgi:hypothetical protein